jgi:hypothetical protein
LTPKNQEFATFQEGTGDTCYCIRESGPCSYHHKCPLFFPELCFVEILGSNSSAYFVYKGDAAHSLSCGIKQMHGVASRNKKAVGITMCHQSVHQVFAVFHDMNSLTTDVTI